MRFLSNIVLMTIFLFTNYSTLFCQGKKNLPKSSRKLSFEIVSNFGKIIKHNKKIIPELTENSFGFELSASYKTFGNKNWHRALNYPEIGISYIQTHFGNRDIFGDTYGFIPFVKFNITRTKFIDFHARLGAGLGIFTKYYHPVSNPTNNVIGSRLNSLIQYKMGLDFHITDAVDISLTGALTHHSNSRTEAPNLGINLPTINLGVIYKPNGFENDFIVKKNPKELLKKNEYTFKLSLGLKDKNPRGAKFPIYSGAIQYARFFGYANKLIIGTIVAFDQHEYDFMRIQEIYEETDQTTQAMDWSVYGGYEMLLGNVGINFLVGAYIIDNGFYDVPIWAKPGITYYFKGFGKKNHHQAFIGVNIKTHYFVAQYAEIHAGIAF